MFAKATDSDELNGVGFISKCEGGSDEEFHGSRHRGGARESRCVEISLSIR